MKRLLLASAILLVPALAIAKGGPREGNDPAITHWFQSQHNMDGGWCCELADGHRLEPGDVRFNAAVNKWEVQLPNPNDPAAPHEWHLIQDWQVRHPDGGANPIGRPILWYDIKGINGSKYYQIWCFDPCTLM